jgi:hypothetical protein
MLYRILRKKSIMNNTLTFQKSRNLSPSSLSNKKPGSFVGTSPTRIKKDGSEYYLPSYASSSKNLLDAYQVDTKSFSRLSGIEERATEQRAERSSLMNDSFKLENSIRQDQFLKRDKSHTSKGLRSPSPVNRNHKSMEFSPTPKFKNPISLDNHSRLEFSDKGGSSNFSSPLKKSNQEEPQSRVTMSFQPIPTDYSNVGLTKPSKSPSKVDPHEDCHKYEQELKAEIGNLQNALKQMQILNEGIQQSRQKTNFSISLDESFGFNFAQDDVKTLKAEIEAQAKIIAELKNVVDRLRQNIQASNMQQDADKDKTSKLEAIIRNLRRENQELKAEVEEASFIVNSSKANKDMKIKLQNEGNRNSSFLSEIDRNKPETEKANRRSRDHKTSGKTQPEISTKGQPTDISSHKGLQDRVLSKNQSSRNVFKEEIYKASSFSELESELAVQNSLDTTRKNRNNSTMSLYQPNTSSGARREDNSILHEIGYDSLRNHNLRKSFESKNGQSEKNLLDHSKRKRDSYRGGSPLPTDEKSRIISFLKSYNTPSEFESVRIKESKTFFDSPMI